MCTGIRFNDNEGNMYFGRNLDWGVSYGEKIVVTPRGYERKYAFDVEPLNSHAVIGPCVVADGIPLYFDCGNEKGLAVAGLNFPGYAQYEEQPVDGKTNVAAYEFPLWVASNFSTVDEAEEALKDVAIVGKPVNEVFPVSFQHWIIGDSERAITVEYMADGMHVYRNDIDVLANQPTFDWQIEHLRSYMNVRPDHEESVMWGKQELKPYGASGMMVGLPGSAYSPDRFVRVAFYNSHYPAKAGEKANVARLFRTLGSVGMVEGGSQMGDGEFEITLYTGGFSAKTLTYYMNTYEDFEIEAYPMRDADLDSGELYTFEK